MKKKYVIFIVIGLFILGGFSFFFLFKNKKEKPTIESNLVQEISSFTEGEIEFTSIQITKEKNRCILACQMENKGKVGKVIDGIGIYVYQEQSLLYMDTMHYFKMLDAGSSIPFEQEMDCIEEEYDEIKMQAFVLNKSDYLNENHPGNPQVGSEKNE